MKSALPFSVFKRADRSCYLVRFKDENTGKFLNPISAKQTDKTLALKTAWNWFQNGIPEKNSKQTVSIDFQHVLETLRKKDITIVEAEKIVIILKQQGVLKSAVLTGSHKDIDLIPFLQNFWDYDNSPYVCERLRKNHSIHRRYCVNSGWYIKNHWKPYFTDRLLSEMRRSDIDNFILHLSTKKLSASGINHCIKAGTVAFKWAYQKELMEKDIFSGHVFFSTDSAERKILTPELAQAFFALQWESKQAKLANKLAVVTGMRAGEIQALQVQNIGKDCLYVCHSWNGIDKLKVTKNNENRIVEVLFRDIMHELLELASENPHGKKMDGYVFWGLLPDVPIDSKIFLKYLRRSLIQIGMSNAEANTYTFHGWRHFFTTHMREKVTDRLLQTQTGHKTLSMLEHYSDHRIQSDKESLQAAQLQVFSDILNPAQYKLLEC